jgi:hypothetical protein
MRARLDRAAGDTIGEAAQIALEGVEIDHERRGVDLVERHADLGGRAHGHGWVSWNGRVRLAQPAGNCNLVVVIDKFS